MFFKLFSDCIPVRGFQRSAIYDLTRNQFYLVPDILSQILADAELNSIEKVVRAYGVENQSVIHEYFSFLNEKELLMWSKEADFESFPAIALVWDYPGNISNAVVELPQSIEMFSGVLQSLQNEGCKCVMLYAEYNSGEPLSSYLDCFEQTAITNVELVIAESILKDSGETLDEIVKRYPRVDRITVFLASEGKVIHGEVPIIYTINDYKILRDNPVNARDFIVNITLFSEAQLYNTHFNRKVAIDKNGDIKNTLFSDQRFGNMQSDKLSEVVTSEAFQKVWHSKKDLTKVCCDCEFRYMCGDSRLAVPDGEMWSHTTECNYNPYIGKWREEPGYISVASYFELNSSDTRK